MASHIPRALQMPPGVFSLCILKALLNTVVIPHFSGGTERCLVLLSNTDVDELLAVVSSRTSLSPFSDVTSFVHLTLKTTYVLLATSRCLYAGLN